MSSGRLPDVPEPWAQLFRQPLVSSLSHCLSPFLAPLMVIDLKAETVLDLEFDQFWFVGGGPVTLAAAADT